jgi:hypothetical protein
VASGARRGKDDRVNPDDGRAGGLVADVPGQGGVAGRGGLPEPGDAGVAERRRVVFPASGLVIEIEVSGSGESRRVAGRLIPAQAGVVEIRGVVTAEADARGRFAAEVVPAGQVSVRCRLGTEESGVRVATGWVVL